MSVYSNLLFLHGHIADTRLALALSAASPSQGSSPGSATGIAIEATSTAAGTPVARRDPMTLFKSLLYLGGLESIDSRIGEEEENFGQTYGNRVASERTFGKPVPNPSPKSFHRRVVPVARNASVPLGCVAGGCG